ncbi:YggT family protein [Rothia sp. ZJ932]|uniref:YggT family protein n=1 Tax=Rothia sp. ZJ932 TaxID=2810516 RepID=UPI001967E7B7|nr:YggT family protein [Rothia sp. ZJ932]QRZ60931.1 YggT family protein [Rothia sp. ZJ932]
MGYLLAVLAFAVYVFQLVLMLRLVLDWVQMFAGSWRPRGVMLVAASAIYAVTDPPMNALRRLVPPIRMGAISFDVGFLILFFAVSFVSIFLQRLLVSFS